MAYGKELILDLHGCDPRTFNRASLRQYFKIVCEKTGMQRADLHFWDDVGVPLADQQTEPHLKGTSAIQFISTSNITIHTLDLLESAYINFFSCKDFAADMVVEISIVFFRAKSQKSTEIIRT